MNAGMARDVMETRLYTLDPQMTITEAVEVFERAGQEQRNKNVGLLVTDAAGELLGMVTMFDMLLLFRPKHVHIWGEMEDVDLRGFFEEPCRRMKTLRVSDIMTTDFVSITPDTHLPGIVDIMIRMHLPRLPVIEDGKIIGIVYISSVFSYLTRGLKSPQEGLSRGGH